MVVIKMNENLNIDNNIIEMINNCEEELTDIFNNINAIPTPTPNINESINNKLNTLVKPKFQLKLFSLLLNKGLTLTKEVLSPFLP